MNDEMSDSRKNCAIKHLFGLFVSCFSGNSCKGGNEKSLYSNSNNYYLLIPKT